MLGHSHRQTWSCDRSRRLETLPALSEPLETPHPASSCGLYTSQTADVTSCEEEVFRERRGQRVTYAKLVLKSKWPVSWSLFGSLKRWSQACTIGFGPSVSDCDMMNKHSIRCLPELRLRWDTNTCAQVSLWVYSHLQLVVCWTFNLQNFGHVGGNVTDQLTEPWEWIPPVQVIHTVSWQEAHQWVGGAAWDTRNSLLRKRGVAKGVHSGRWGTYEDEGGFTSSCSLQT